MSDEGINWSKPLIGGLADRGFDSAYFSMGGIGNPPYAFFMDSLLEGNLSEIVYFDKWTEYPYTYDPETEGGERDGGGAKERGREGKRRRGRQN